MKPIFTVGDSKTYTMVVKSEDVAAFHGKVVHPVCSTFVLAREVEWTTRQFVLDMKGADEEGIGTFVSIDHSSPAFVGEEIVFIGKIETINQHELICTFEARVGQRLIASGRTGQKILKKDKIDSLFNKIRGSESRTV
jgi:fluoroacetyl-CoA thioesterase